MIDALRIEHPIKFSSVHAVQTLRQAIQGSLQQLSARSDHVRGTTQYLRALWAWFFPPIALAPSPSSHYDPSLRIQSTDVASFFCRKFGKHIQKRQLDIPEYAASFVDYKALKKVRLMFISSCQTEAISLWAFTYHSNSLSRNSALLPSSRPRA